MLCCFSQKDRLQSLPLLDHLHLLLLAKPLDNPQTQYPHFYTAAKANTMRQGSGVNTVLSWIFAIEYVFGWSVCVFVRLRLIFRLTGVWPDCLCVNQCVMHTRTSVCMYVYSCCVISWICYRQCIEPLSPGWAAAWRADGRDVILLSPSGHGGSPASYLNLIKPTPQHTYTHIFHLYNSLLGCWIYQQNEQELLIFLRI